MCFGIVLFFFFPSSFGVSEGRSSLEESGGSVRVVQVESSGGLGGGGLRGRGAGGASRIGQRLGRTLQRSFYQV